MKELKTRPQTGTDEYVVTIEYAIFSCWLSDDYEVRADSYANAINIALMHHAETEGADGDIIQITVA